MVRERAEQAPASPATSSDHGVEPVRTCVGCRGRAPASTLLRVIADVDTGPARLVIDPRHRLPGRGAYLHMDPACLAKAERRRAFVRALRVGGILDTGELRTYVTAQAVRTGTARWGDREDGRWTPR
ncbi:MAG TPA: YlxR family protein [Micromonosporaceae bacterium]